MKLKMEEQTIPIKMRSNMSAPRIEKIATETDIKILRAEIKGNFKIVYITEAAIFTGVLFLCLIEFFR